MTSCKMSKILVLYFRRTILHPGFTPWFYTLILHPDFTPWFDTLVLHPGFTPWFYTLVLHTDITPWFYTLILHYLLLPITPSVIVWQIDVNAAAPIPGTLCHTVVALETSRQETMWTYPTNHAIFSIFFSVFFFFKGSMVHPIQHLVPWAPVLHWAVIYHGITGYQPNNGALRNLYNPTCTYTHLQNKLVDQLVSVA